MTDPVFIYDFFESPTLSLTDVVEFALDEYEQAFKYHWGLDAKEPPEHLTFDEWREYVQLYGLAQKLARGASSLVRPRRVREDVLSRRDVLEEEAEAEQKSVDQLLKKVRDVLAEDVWQELYWYLKPHKPSDPRMKESFFRNCMEIEASLLFPCSLWEMANSMFKLLGFMVRAPGIFTEGYLGRVAECYVRNMKTEFSVMARAALDSAIQELIDDDEVAGLVGLRSDWRIDLERRIEACAARSWFDRDTCLSAHRVREAGRDAAHFVPELEGGIDDLLEDLVCALRALELAKK